jgi:hypothetical protein
MGIVTALAGLGVGALHLAANARRAWWAKRDGTTLRALSVDALAPRADGAPPVVDTVAEIPDGRNVTFAITSDFVYVALESGTCLDHATPPGGSAPQCASESLSVRVERHAAP